MPSTTTDWANEVWSLAKPGVAIALLAIVGTVATIVVGILRLFAKKLGINIDDATYARLRTLAEDALTYAITKAVGSPTNMVVNGVPPAVMSMAIDHMRQHDPDITAGIPDDMLHEIVLSKVPQVQAVVSSALHTPTSTAR